MAQAQQLDAVAQHVQRAAVVQALAQPIEQGVFGGGAVVLAPRRPGGGLRGLHPGQHVGGEEGAGAVVCRDVAFGMQPTRSGQVGADFVFEVDLAVQCHGKKRASNSAGERIG